MFHLIRIHTSWNQDRVETISQSLARDFRRLLEAKNEILAPDSSRKCILTSWIVLRRFIRSLIRVFVVNIRSFTNFHCKDRLCIKSPLEIILRVAQPLIQFSLAETRGFFIFFFFSSNSVSNYHRDMIKTVTLVFEYSS